jgi:hypothetical protein
MAPQPGTTHCLEIRGDVVVKRFRSHARGEPWREWRALCMLASYAPDLAPAPEHAALDAEPPVVVMSRLPGDAMGTQPLTASQVAAVAASIRRLHHAAPPEVLEATEPMPFGPVTAVARVRAMAAALGVPEDPAARHALSCASTWLDLGPVLAIFTEHVSVHGRGQVPAELALGHFPIDAAERARIREYRRLLATFWLLMLLPGGPSYRRNPPGTLQDQALRLLELLG